MLDSWPFCCRRRFAKVVDGFELVEDPVTIVTERPSGDSQSFRGVPQYRQDIARRAGLEANKKLQGKKQRVAPVARETPGGRLKNRVWVVIRTKGYRTLGQSFSTWSAASVHCLDHYSGEPAAAAIFHGWPSKVEADIYLSTALR
jgi:hypothetical protein